MTIHVDTVARMRAYEEPSGSFGTDHSGTAGDFKDIPFVEGSVKLELIEPMESPLTTQQLIDAYPTEVHMPKRAKLSFDILLTGLGLATGLRSQSGLGRLLKVGMGGEYLGTSTTINDASPAVLTNTFTSASLFMRGEAIAVTTGTGGRLEMREIDSISTNDVTLKHNLSSAVTNGGTVYAPAMYYLGNRYELGDGSMATSLQVIYEGLEPDDRWLLRGGQMTGFTISLPVGGLPKISFEWTFADWLYADGSNTAGDFVGPELAVATYSNARPIVLKDSELLVTTVGTAAPGSAISASSFEFSPNLSHMPQMAPGGLNNIVGWNRVRSAPVISGSFTLPYEDQTWFALKAADTPMAFFLQIGSSPTASTGGGVLLSAATIQITDVQRVSVDGLGYQTVSWKGTTDTEVASPSTSANYSAFRIQMF